MRPEVAAPEPARPDDIASASVNRPRSARGATPVGVARIRALFHARAADRPHADWIAVVAEVIDEASFDVRWNGDEVVSLDARA